VLRDVYESNEANNVRYDDYVIVAALPDLNVPWFDVSPNPSVLGTQLTYDVAVQNTGATPAGPFTVDLWFHRSSAPGVGSAGYNHRRSYSGLAESSSHSYFVQYTPQGTGSRTAWVLVDSQGQVPESNEVNNRSSDQYTISPSSSSSAGGGARRPRME
jgi:hypothetical protein